MFFVCTDKMFGVIMCGGGISKYHIAQPLGLYDVFNVQFLAVT